MIDRQALEQALKAGSRPCFEHLPLASLVSAGEGQILLANDALAQLLERPQASLIGAAVAELVPPARRAELAAAMRSADETGSCAYETEVVRRDATRIPVQIAIGAVHDPAGRVQARMMYFDDKAQRIEAERQDVQLDTLIAVVNQLPAALFAVDAQGRYLVAEGGGFAPIGIRPGQLTGASAFEVFEGVPWVIDNLRRALSGHAYTGMGEAFGTIGEATVVPVRDHENQVTGAAGITLVVTERYRAMQQRERLIAQLREAVSMRERFLPIAAHELRTPLTALRLKLDLLVRNAQRQGPRVPAAWLLPRLGELERVAGRVGRLIDELLDVARLTTGRFTLECESTDLAQLAHAVTRRMRPAFERMGSRLSLAAEHPVLGCWDPLRIEHVLENLLSHALERGAHGGHVEVQIKSDASHAVVVVRDHGPDMPSDDQAPPSERFVRREPLESSGLGLRLYLTREIVHAHGGSIRFESLQGRGGALIATLPRGQAQESSAAETS